MTAQTFLVPLASEWLKQAVPGALATAGPVGAAWRIVATVAATERHDSCYVTLEPVPAHSVPVMADVVVLPRPLAVVSALPA